MEKIRCEWNKKKHQGKKCPHHKKLSNHEKARNILGVDCGDVDEHSDRLCDILRKNNINEKLLKQKMNNYSKISEVRSIINGDVGNFNGLSNEDLKELLDDWGYDYKEEDNDIIYKVKEQDD